LRINIAELGGRDESVDGSCPPAAFVRAGECPVTASDGDGTQLALGGVREMAAFLWAIGQEVQPRSAA
jgi:hypothetical protein